MMGTQAHEPLIHKSHKDQDALSSLLMPSTHLNQFQLNRGMIFFIKTNGIFSKFHLPVNEPDQRGACRAIICPQPCPQQQHTRRT